MFGPSEILTTPARLFIKVGLSGYIGSPYRSLRNVKQRVSAAAIIAQTLSSLMATSRTSERPISGTGDARSTTSKGGSLVQGRPKRLLGPHGSSPQQRNSFDSVTTQPTPSSSTIWLADAPIKSRAYRGTNPSYSVVSFAPQQYTAPSTCTAHDVVPLVARLLTRPGTGIMEGES